MSLNYMLSLKHALTVILKHQMAKFKSLFDLQVTPMIPTKFQINWPFGSGEEAKNRFSRWASWRPSWIYNQNDFSCFLSISPYMPYLTL